MKPAMAKKGGAAMKVAGVTKDVDETKLVLTVEEAARLLRIGRSAGYELARRYLATGGAEGLPVVRLGRILRVPRRALVRMLEGDLTQEPDLSKRIDIW